MVTYWNNMNKTYYIRLKNDLKLDKIKEPEKYMKED